MNDEQIEAPTSAPNPINKDREVKEIFESSDAQTLGIMGKSIDNSQFKTPAEREDFLENLLKEELLGVPCHVCGNPFNDEDVTQAIFLGPIENEEQAAHSHKKCFDEIIVEKPELTELINKGLTWEKLTEEERQVWKDAFSSVPPDSLYEKLFEGPKK